MDRLWEANSSTTPPTKPATLETGYPTDAGDATIPGAWWFYQQTEEIRNAIVAAGITPSGDSVTQLAQAIGAIASNAINNYMNAGASSGSFTSMSLSGQLTSTVAQGTAPLVVNSTTPVANLSIGGNAATATLAANATNAVNAQSAATLSAVLSVTKGGSGVASINGILRGNGAQPYTVATPDVDYLTPDSNLDGGTY